MRIIVSIARPKWGVRSLIVGIGMYLCGIATDAEKKMLTYMRLTEKNYAPNVR